MNTPTTTSAVRLTTAALTQYLATHSSLRNSQTGGDRRRVVLLRCAPQWDGPAEVALEEEHHARVAVAPSPLAVHELVLDHLDGDTDNPRVLVVLTDREQPELDPAILARVYKQRIDTVSNWDLIQEAFGATDVDSRLKQENWAAEALLEATPPGGWPRLPGGTLSRRAGLTALALRRLRLGRYAEHPTTRGLDSDSLDPHTLLRWSLTPGGPEQLLGLRETERHGLAQFLAETEQAGPTGEILAALTENGHGADAVPFGLVCAALWDHDAPDVATYRACGRAEQWLGPTPPATGEALDERLAVFGRSCAEYVRVLLQTSHSDGETAREARRTTEPVLQRASQLVRQFGAGTAAATSPILREGLDARFTATGHALADGSPNAVAQAVAELGKHWLATEPDVRVRVERARMGQRLTQWLTTAPAAGSDTVAAAVQRHIGDTGWVDRALDHIQAGGDPDPQLKAAYDTLGARVRETRRGIDRSFATTLATWTTAGTGPGSMLTVESFLSRVAAPVAATKRRVLLLLLDGMSAAIATELAEELRYHWAEYDPLPENTESPPRRRGMAAALPTLTAVSRTSLFAGELTRGTQDDERRLFSQHRFRRQLQASVFHKDELRGQSPGDTFGPGLSDALAEEHTHVAVVLNTIDDRLAKEQKLGDGAWHPDEIGKLRELLREAATQGMAVLITSDHGHVVDRYGTKVDTAGAASARHREPAPGQGAPADSEVALSGPRVVAPESGGEVVALWDADSRYTTQKAGYHGGASLAEVAIPVLAFLPFGANPPSGWRELGDQRPSWWLLEPEASVEVSAPAVPEATPAPRSTRTPTRRVEPDREHDALFDLPEEPPQSADTQDAQPPEESLADQLLATETFQAQVELLARKPPMEKVENAIRVLTETTTLPATALAQRVGYRQSRADGFAAVLRQLLNYDGIQVLETLSDGRTLRLNLPLLRDQFELGGQR
ncbi:PglZ domain-containing protein [Haloactinospora alba]|uniref:PglZ domain-containing protein n=1 Tax=Haloactinospora alba TaxID=405555 RepID=A0A543NKA7_9ACTN|nr:BREX-2 system phosphatase PglZ [Haloactinospora alba]TQN32220.1 PglZ domain-containing protein [Haloactinospora alba]